MQVLPSGKPLGLQPSQSPTNAYTKKFKQPSGGPQHSSQLRSADQKSMKKQLDPKYQKQNSTKNTKLATQQVTQPANKTNSAGTSQSPTRQKYQNQFVKRGPSDKQSRKQLLPQAIDDRDNSGEEQKRIKAENKDLGDMKT